MARVPRVPFHFHAEGHAFSGEIHHPIWHPIEAKAATSLPTIGGHATAHVENFSSQDFVSFKKAHTHVSGRQESKDVYVTHATTTIEHFNIEDVLTADRIISRLTSVHDRQHPEGVILANGSRFENLRISGHKVEVTLRYKLLEESHTFEQLSKRVGSEKGTVAPSGTGVVICSLVEKIETDLPYIPKDGGNVFEVPNFGKITLAEIFAEAGTRTLTMMHLELGSPQTLNATLGETRTNGKPMPSGPGG